MMLENKVEGKDLALFSYDYAQCPVLLCLRLFALILPDQLLTCSSLEGVAKIAVRFQKDDDPDQVMKIEAFSTE